MICLLRFAKHHPTYIAAKIRAIVAVFLVCIATAHSWSEESTFHIVGVTPSGVDVPATIGEITLEFSHDVIAFGQSDGEYSSSHIKFSPQLGCSWQWISPSTLTCYLNEDLKRSSSYTLLVEGDFEALDGSKLGTEYEYQIKTELPKLERSTVGWRSPVEATVELSFSQPVTRSSLLKSLRLRDNSTGELIAGTKFNFVITRPSRMYFRHDDGRWERIANYESRTKTRFQLTDQSEIAFSTWYVQVLKELSQGTSHVLEIAPSLESIHGDLPTESVLRSQQFTPFPDFELIGLKCTDQTGEFIEVNVPKGSLNLPDIPSCHPNRGVLLAFTVPVHDEATIDVLSENPMEMAVSADLTESNYYASDYDTYRRGIRVMLRSASPIYLAKVDMSLGGDSLYRIGSTKAPTAPTGEEPHESAAKDIFGRSLTFPGEIRFRTLHLDPNLELPNRTVLKSESNTDLEVTSLNLSSLEWDVAVRKGAADRELARHALTLPVNADLNQNATIPLQVREVLGGETGQFIGTLTSQVPQGFSDLPEKACVQGQVTPYSVFVRLGRFSSIAWVTDIHTGDPVSDARVSVVEATGLNLNVLFETTSNEAGVALLPGTSELWSLRLFEGNLKASEEIPVEDESGRSRCSWETTKRSAILIEGTAGSALLRMGYLPDESDPHPSYRHRLSQFVEIWGHTAQGIYRPGERVQYKIYVRDIGSSGLIKPADRTYRLAVVAREANVVHERTGIKLNDFGTFHGSFVIPDDIKQGRLNFRVMLDDEHAPRSFEVDYLGTTEEDRLQEQRVRLLTTIAMHVRVTDFVAETFKVTTELDSESYKVGDVLTVNSEAALHAGGPYTNAPFSVNATLRSVRFVSEHPESKDHVFWHEYKFRRFQSHSFTSPHELTDTNGLVALSRELNSTDVLNGELFVEFAIQGDRGKSVADTATARYRSTDRFVGIRSIGRGATVAKEKSVDVIVVDPDGVPVNDLPVKVQFTRKEILLEEGDRYSWKTNYEEISSCDIPAHALDRRCAFTPSTPGYYRVTGSIVSETEPAQSVSLNFFVLGAGRLQVTQRETIQIKPETPATPDKPIIKGDVAKFVVENPHPGAYALITVGRMGILDHWVKKMPHSLENIEIPIKAEYAPNTTVAVAIMAADASKATSYLVADPNEAKHPVARTGSVGIEVTDPSKQLDVDITTDRNTYSPGDVVSVEISMLQRNKLTPNEPFEIAVTVLDEGVIDLLQDGIRRFDPRIGLRNNTFAISEYMLFNGNWSVAGFRVNGMSSRPGPRSNEKLVSYWNPSVRSDESGKASFEFTVGDRLTGWRILATAVSPNELSGFGESTISTTLPIEIQPMMPNQVTESDRFDAAFTVMNRTHREQRIDVRVASSGDTEGATSIETISVQPFERQVVTAAVEAKLQDQFADEGAIHIEVAATDGKSHDSMRHELPVYADRRTRFFSIRGSTTQSAVREPVKLPFDVKQGTGKLNVQLESSIVKGAKGPISYMRDYPYGCWEQRLSQAVAALQHERLREILDSEWQRTDQVIRKVLEDAPRFQAPSGGFGYWRPSDGHADIYLSAYTALALQWMQEAGYQIPNEMYTKLLQYLYDNLYKDAFPEYLKEATSAIPTLKALILNVLVKYDKRYLTKLDEVATNLDLMNPYGIVHMLDVIQSAGVAAPWQDTAVKLLTNRLARSGEYTLIQHDVGSGYFYLLPRALTTTCAAVSMFSRFHESGKPLVDSEIVASLARGIVFAKNHQDHWQNTHQTAICLNALLDFARVMESRGALIEPDVAITLENGRKSLKLSDESGAQSDSSGYSYTTTLKPEFLDLNGQLEIKNNGSGRFYYRASMWYEPTEFSHDRENNGIDIRRSYWVKHGDGWVEVDEKTQLSRGQLVHVELYVHVRDPRSFVVVDDPVPGALEPVDTGLANVARESVRHDHALNEAVKRVHGDHRWVRFSTGSRWGFYHRELGHDFVRFYNDFLPSGKYRLTWVGQVVGTGKFLARQSHAEAMYSPDIYGRSQALRLTVRPIDK